jgi:type I restriction enzyme S subunit
VKTAELRWNATIYAGGTPSRDRADFWESGTIPWLNSGAVNDWRITEPSALITEEAIASSSARWIPARSVVIALAGQGRTKGTAARLEVATTCNQSMAAIVPSSRLDYRYLHHVLHSMYEPIRNMAGGDLRDGLNLQHIGNIRIPVMPLEEQRRIADFLDDQVNRIDQAVAARQRQESLLDEQWQAELFHAMTQGQHLDVPLRSQVWFQEGPGILASDFREEGLPILRIAHLRMTVPSLADAQCVEPESGYTRWGHFLTRIGDLMISGSASAGALAVWISEETAGAIPYTGLIRTRPRTALLDAGYLRYFFMSPVFTNQVDSLKQGIGIQHWGPTHLSQVRMPLPPLETQRGVVSQLSERETVRESLANGLARSLDLLLLFKRSLITAAVTGELDVTTARRGLPV